MRQKMARKIMSFLLALAMVIGLMPVMSMPVKAENSNEGWTDSCPTEGEYVLVCKAAPSKVLTYYDNKYQYSTYNGDSGQKWNLVRLTEGKPSYKIIFGDDNAIDVPGYENFLNYGDYVSTLPYAHYPNFSEYETNVFRFSQREGGPSNKEYAIRVVSEEYGKYDYVLQGFFDPNYSALRVGQYNDNNTAQYWSFSTIDDYVESEHEHSLSYAASGDSIIATCTNDGVCFLEDKKAVLTLLPPSNITIADTFDDEREATIEISGEGVSKTKAFTDDNTAVGTVSYYKATLNGATYEIGEELEEAPKEVGDYVAEVKVTVNGTDYTLSTGYTILNRIIAGTGTATHNSLPTSTGWNYSWSQQIYDKNDIKRSGDITALDFYNAGDSRTRKLELYLTETDKEAFNNRTDWVPISEDSKVFSGDVTFNSDEWTTIEFDTPFGYLGNKNLLLCVNDTTGSSDYGAKFKAGNTDSYAAIYANNDNVAYNISNPNVDGTIGSVINQIRLEIQDFVPVTVTLNGGGNAQTSGGAIIQEVPTGAMTPVIYKANNNYFFEPFDDISDGGITATRTDDTTVTVSGIPEDDVAITVPNAIYHEHSFSYDVDGATITASCSDSDLHSQGYVATLTIGKPLHKKYSDGLDATAQITDENGIIGEAVIKYYHANESGERTGEELTSAPTDVGTYRAEITLGEGDGAKTAHIVYAIAKDDAPDLSEDEARQALIISYINETVTISGDYDISSDGQVQADLTEGQLSLTEILNDVNPKIYVRRSETENVSAGAWVEVSLLSRPAAPTNLTTTNATNGNTTDGTIVGTTAAMEYKNSEDGKQPTAWTGASASEITGLKSGTYLVRIKATDSAPHGFSAEVEVGSNYKLLTDAAPTITITEKGTGNTETGIPQIGDTLTATPDPENANPVTYEWYRGGTKIEGETGAEYTITAADVGSKIHVTASQEEGADGSGSTEVTTEPSAETETVKKKTNTVDKITVEALKGYIEKTGTSITIKPVTAGYEYTVVAKGTTPEDSAWRQAESGQEENGLLFTNLQPGTEYDVLVRAVGNDDTQPGEATKATVMTNVEVTIDGPFIQGLETGISIEPEVSGPTYKWYIDDSSQSDGEGTKVVPSLAGNKLTVEAYKNGDLIGTDSKTNVITSFSSYLQDSINTFGDESANYTLKPAGKITGDVQIPVGIVNIDLNGQTITGSINVPGEATLTITDSSNTQTGTVKGTVSADTGDVVIKGGRYDNLPSATDPGTVTIEGGMFKTEPSLEADYGIKEVQGDYPKQVLPRATVGQTPVGRTDLISNGSNQVLITEGVGTNGTMYYALRENGLPAPEFDGTSTETDRKWKTSIPKGKEAGTYYVWYMVRGNDTHSDSVPVCIIVNVELGPPSVREVLTDAINYETGVFKQSTKYEIYFGASQPDSNTEPTENFDLLTNIVDLDVNNDANDDNDVKLYVRAKKDDDESAWVYIPLPGRQSTDGISANYEKDVITGMRDGIWFTTDGSDPSDSSKWQNYDSTDLTKSPISWTGDETVPKPLKFIIPGDNDKQLFPSKVKTITLGSKGTAPTVDDLNGYAIPDDNISYRSVNLPTPKDNTKKLQYRYRKNPDGPWTSWGSNDKAIGLEMGTEYGYELRFAPGTDEHGNIITPASKSFPNTPATFKTKISKPDVDDFLNKHVDYSVSPAKFIGTSNVFEYTESDTGTTGTSFSNGSDIPDYPSGFYVRYKDTGNGEPSDWQQFPSSNIPADVDRVESVNEAPISGAGGKLTGTDTGMEYRYREKDTDDWTDWIPCTDNMTGLKPGQYQVRKKASGSGLPSFAKHLVINESNEKATISIEVKDSTNNPVTDADVTASLVGEENKTQVPYRNETQNYSISGLSAGTYMIVVTGEDGHQVTKLVNVDKADNPVEIILPTGKENSSKLVDNTGNNIAVGGIDEQAKKLDTTEEQNEYLITFKAEEKSEAESDAKDAINDIKSQSESDPTYKDSEGKSVDVQKQFIDFTVEKTLISSTVSTTNDVGTTTKIEDTARVMEIIYPYPQIDSRFGIMVWRYHSGTQRFSRLTSRPETTSAMKDATYFIDRLEKRLYIYGSKFSTYSITYAENPDIADPDTSGTSGGGSGGGGTIPTTIPDPVIIQPEHGIITINPARPGAGTQVVITVTPEEGYETENVTVTDRYGNPVEVIKNEDGTYTFVNPADGGAIITANILPKNAVKVKFDLNGKEGIAPETQGVAKGEKAVRPTTDPVAEGYQFIGWFKDRACEKPYNFDTPVEEDITLYAGWQRSDQDDEGLGIYFAELFDDPYDGVYYNADYNSGEGRYEIVYTGAPIKPLIRVTSKADGMLREGIDYTVSYSNNKNYSKDKPAIITISGKGFYKSEKILELYILQADLAVAYDKGLIAGASELSVLSGSRLNPVIVYRGYKLGSSDRIVSNKDKIRADTTIDITGKGNFRGELKDIPVKVISKDQKKKSAIKVSLKAEDHVYSGEPQELSISTQDAAGELTVTAGSSKIPLIKDTDFVVKYSYNTNAGKATVTVTGIGQYNGTVVRSFKIKPDKTCTIEADADEPVYYNARGAKADLTVISYRKADNETETTEVLTEGKDYKVSYSSNKKVGNGSYTIKFFGNYKGHKDKKGTFTIVPALLNDEAKVEAAQMIYKKPGKYLPKPYVSVGGVLLKASDYTFKYYEGVVTDVTAEDVKELTSKDKLKLEDGEMEKTITIAVTGKGNYTGAVLGTYRIIRAKEGAKDLTRAKIVARDKKNGKYVAVSGKEYTGYEIEPEIRVLFRKNKQWVEEDPAHYSVSYINNLNKGKATILVTGDGENAIGAKTAKFSISTMRFELFRLILGR